MVSVSALKLLIRILEYIARLSIGGTVGFN
jgi:hypothetical protein